MRRKQRAAGVGCLALGLGVASGSQAAFAADAVVDSAAPESPRLFRLMGGFGGGVGGPGPFGSTGVGGQLSGRALLQL